MRRIISFIRNDRGENSIMQVIVVAVSATLITAGLITFPGMIESARETAARSVVAQLIAIQSGELSRNGHYAEIGPSILRGGSLKGGADLDEGAAGCNSDVSSCQNIAVIPGFTSPSVTPAEEGQYNCFSVFVRTKTAVFYYQSRQIGPGDQVFKLGTPGTDDLPASPAAIQYQTGQVAADFPGGYSTCYANPQGLDSKWWPTSIEAIPWY